MGRSTEEFLKGSCMSLVKWLDVSVSRLNFIEDEDKGTQNVAECNKISRYYEIDFGK